MIKIGNQVMTSFPETLHCLLIINAPTWFGVVWSVAKKLIDPRTASKIEVVRIFTSTAYDVLVHCQRTQSAFIIPSHSLLSLRIPNLDSNEW
jgi:hypothetical protein